MDQQNNNGNNQYNNGQQNGQNNNNGGYYEPDSWDSACYSYASSSGSGMSGYEADLESNASGQSGR